MEISEKCDLFLKDAHYYDLKQCYYNLLVSLGYDVSNIPTEKTQRNIAIGILTRDNPQIGSILRHSTNGIISKTLTDNNVSEDELITRQFDGIIVTRKLSKVLDNFKLIVYRELIISTNRKSYLAVKTNSNVVVKGISKKYDSINYIYKMFSEINYLSKTAIFRKLDKIKKEVLDNTNFKTFCIPTKYENKYNIVLHRHGVVTIKEDALQYMSTKDVNKDWYFDHYFRPFTESIFIEFV